MDGRATSPVVGVALLVGATVVLAAGLGTAATGLDGSPAGSKPRVAIAAPAVNASDAWPGGQRLRLVHAGGEAVAVQRVELVVSGPHGRSARLTGFPTRRLAAGNVRGDDLFDQGFAGVDGALDAAHTDGRWEAGESTSIRLAREDVDLRPGDTVGVTVVISDAGAVADIAVSVRQSGAA